MSGFKDFMGPTAWRKHASQVGICDEVGITNVKINDDDSGGSKRSQYLLPAAPPGASLYGGTLCARMKLETQCAQFLVALETAEDFKGDAHQWSADQLRIYPERPSPSPGHRFFPGIHLCAVCQRGLQQNE